MAADEKVVGLFRKEARTLTKLQHEALVSYRVLAQEPQLGVLYIVTEFIEGVELGEMLGAIDMARGAKVIHVDPRFTRTSAMADTYDPLRAGSDIAFLGGIINHVVQNELDFREYVVAYTNAATIVSED